MAMKKQMLQKLAAQKEQEDLKSSPTRCLQRKMCKSDHESKGMFFNGINCAFPRVFDFFRRGWWVNLCKKR